LAWGGQELAAGGLNREYSHYHGMEKGFICEVVANSG